MNKRIIIVGYGVVGQLEYNVLREKYFPEILDLNQSFVNKTPMTFELALEEVKNITYDLAIVAVPTPYDENVGVLDCHLVYDAISEVNAKVYLIKSTTNIGYCDYLALQTGKHIVHSPEHSGATQHCNNFNYKFTILGGNVEDCQFVQEIYQEVYDARHIFRYVTRSEAESAKLVENAYLANTVSFWTSVWESCQNKNVCFENVREAVLLDPRIPRPHSAVYPSHPYWDSHCLNKDEIAYANQTDNEYLKNTYYYNEKMKRRYKNKD